MRAERANQLFTVDDYFAWPDEPRCELIDGVYYDMAAAPVLEHQRVGGDLFRALAEHAERRRTAGGDRGGPGCEVLMAPVDVVLDATTVLQPDIVIVCHPAKLANGRYVDGAPDVVVEILSPSTALKDRREKLATYERAGVHDYLLVDPDEHVMEHHVLGDDGRYGRPEVMGPEDFLQLAVLPRLCARLTDLFHWPIPEVKEPVAAYG